MVLGARSLPYAGACLASLFRSAIEPLQLTLITDGPGDVQGLTAAMAAIAPGAQHSWSVAGKAEADQRADALPAGLHHLREFRQGHPCWRKVTDPALFAEDGREVIILDPDVYFPNPFRFEATPAEGLLLMWQAPNCLHPPEVVRAAFDAGIRMADHTDIGVCQLAAPPDWQWLDWLVGRLGGRDLPRSMHVESIVWAALAMQAGGGYLDPRPWVCWRNTVWGRVRSRLGAEGAELLQVPPRRRRGQGLAGRRRAEGHPPPRPPARNGVQTRPLPRISPVQVRPQAPDPGRGPQARRLQDPWPALLNPLPEAPPMKILLTGGAGYIGSACLRWLLKHGHDPIAYDSMLEGNASAVPEGRLVEGDILDLDKLTATLREHKVEAVMHFAALASVPDSIADPDNYWEVNTVGTKNVLDAMISAGIDKIVFSSTAATYAFGTPMPLTEDSPQHPQTPYGTSKLAAEWLIKDYARAYDLGYAIFRYFNASGADPDGNFGESRHVEGHLIPLTLLVAVGRREKLKVYGGDWDTRDGSCVRDYVHTEDLAQAHQLAIENIGPGVGRVYNLGSGTGASVLEVLKACEEVVGRPIPHEVVGRRPGDPGTLIAPPDKIIRELGYAPKYNDIRQIVETAWRWHGTHPDGYGSR
jgi:UDP-glucose 4-epimerase